MKIWYQDQWLVTGRDVDDIAPLDPIEFGGKQAVKIAAYLRGAAVVPFARGGREQLFRLKTIRQCESYSEAVRLAAMALQLVQTSGELRIELEDGSTLTANPAAVQGCTPERVGLSLTLAWEFTLGTWVEDFVAGTIWSGGDYTTLPQKIRRGGWYGDLNLIKRPIVGGGSY